MRRFVAVFVATVAGLVVLLSFKETPTKAPPSAGVVWPDRGRFVGSRFRRSAGELGCRQLGASPAPALASGSAGSSCVRSSSAAALRVRRTAAPTPTKSSAKPTPKPTPKPSPTASSVTKTVTGSTVSVREGRRVFGAVQVRLTLTNGKITAATAINYPEQRLAVVPDQLVLDSDPEPRSAVRRRDRRSPSCQGRPIRATRTRSRCRRRSTQRRRDVPRPLVHVEHVMGTVVSFDLRFVDDSQRAPMQAAVADAVIWLHRVDDVFSTYRSDSQISRLGRGELRLTDCDDDVAEVLDLCAEIGRESDGYFSSTYGGQLDPTGLVKGWAVQRASEILTAAGCEHHCVNGGGDIQAVGGMRGRQSLGHRHLAPFATRRIRQRRDDDGRRGGDVRHRRAGGSRARSAHRAAGYRRSPA